MRLYQKDDAMNTTTDWVAATTRIPDLLQAAPQARGVLDRYGLRGCGGRDGPAETLAYFARAHAVPLDRLLDDVRAEVAVQTSEVSETSEVSPRFADTIYRPFFRAGIVVVLTLGAAWGAYLLVRIALDGAFTAAGLHEINAHGHAQIFGWVGLFVMGFAYQAFPRFAHTELPCPRLAGASLVLMLAGLVARSLLQPIATGQPLLIAAAVAASLLEVAAVALFAAIIVVMWRRAGTRLAVHQWYIACALVWFVVQAVYESIYLAATLTVEGPPLMALVQTWQAPLRDVQIHGFAMLMILGVSQRLFHPMYCLPAPNPRRAAWALALLNAAVIGEAAGLILRRLAGNGWTALWYGAVLVLAATTLWLVRDWHLYVRAKDSDRSLKFLRTAYVWLFVSLAMLVLLPVYQFGLVGHFSHAYYGAIRHAITVGFVSLMIVGVAARVVPTLNGVDVRRLPALWVPFLLINAGCTLRVVGQTLTDFTDTAFLLAGVSGLLEVTGLAIWGVHLWRIMASRGAVLQAPPLEPGMPITAAHRVGDVLTLHPQLLDVFVAHGFRPLANPVARRTIAHRVTVEAACRLLGVDVQELLAALNDTVGPCRSLTVVTAPPRGCDCCRHD
jgi:hypothetical protein